MINIVESNLQSFWIMGPGNNDFYSPEEQIPIRIRGLV